MIYISPISLMAALAWALAWSPAPPAFAQRSAKPTPTAKNVAYGPHERNVLDFWQVASKSEAPAPLVVFIHGGGFVGGDKEGVSAKILTSLLDAGISVASLNYRFATQAPLPAAHHDCRRAIQFLRSKAKEWNLDKSRVGAYGSSAGAQLSMYLAFHDEMAKPESDDPVQRESTRLTCVATIGGQTTSDVDWWTKHIPGYATPHVDFMARLGAKTQAEYRAVVEEISALSLISKDDPPIFMTYAMRPDDPVPTDPRQARGWSVHHVIFGSELKKQTDRLGIEAELHYPGATTAHASIAEFFIDMLSE